MAAPTPGTIPVPYFYQGHTYWLQPSGQWTNGQSASSNKVAGSIVQALMAGSGTATNNPTGGPPVGDGTQPSHGNPPPTGGGMLPPPATTVPDVWAPGAATNTSPFGDYTLDPYLLATGSPSAAAPVPAAPSAAPSSPLQLPANGGGVGGLPGGAGVPPVVPPTGTAPPPSGTPMPSPQGQGGMFGGNEGGAQGNHGGMLGNAGAGGNASGGMIGPGGSAAGWNWGPNQGIDLGPWGAGALQAASTLAPFPYGTAIGLAQTAMRGYNTANANAVRGSLGAPDLDFGQVVGSLLGLNGYGALAGNQTFINRDQNTDVNGHPVAVTQGGYYDPGFLQRLFTGDQAGTAYTPEEKRRRDLAAARPSGGNGAPSLAGGFGSNDTSASSVGQAYGLKPGTAALSGPAIVAGNTVAPTLSAKEQAELALYNAKNGLDANGQASSGFTGNNGSATGMGGNGFSGNLSAGIGNAVSAGGTGGLQNGFGGGGYAHGGYVRGRPDRIPDNRRIAANEGEYVVQNAAAKAAGRRLLGMLNTPAGAKRLRGMLG